MQDKFFLILKYLDAPERYLFWTIDEAIILISPLMVGLIAGQFLLGLIIGPLGLVGLKRLKGTRGEKALYHAFFWYFLAPWGDGLKATQPSNRRVFVGQ